MAGAVLVYDLVEIEEQVRHEGPGCQVILLEGGIGFAFAEANKFSGSRRISGETVLVCLKGGQHDFRFFRTGITGGDQPPCPADTVLRICSAFLENALGKGARRFDVFNIVHQLQRLHRGIAAATYRAALFAVGAIKGSHEGWRSGTLEEGVKAASIQVLTLALLVIAGVAGGKADRFPYIGGLVGSDAPSSDPGHH